MSPVKTDVLSSDSLPLALQTVVVDPHSPCAVAGPVSLTAVSGHTPCLCPLPSMPQGCQETEKPDQGAQLSSHS